MTHQKSLVYSIYFQIMQSYFQDGLLKWSNALHHLIARNSPVVGHGCSWYEYGPGYEIWYGLGYAIWYGVGYAIWYGVGYEIWYGLGYEIWYGPGYAIWYGVGYEIWYGLGYEIWYGPGYTCSPCGCIYTDLVTHVLRVTVYIRTWLRMFSVWLFIYGPGYACSPCGCLFSPPAGGSSVDVSL